MTLLIWVVCKENKINNGRNKTLDNHILVEINAEGVEMCKKVSIYDQNHRAEQMPNSEKILHNVDKT